MDSQLFTLSKIFTERLFRIPDYQRGYAWTEPQWKDFWNDIAQIEEGSNHYTGVLTLEIVPQHDRASWHEDNWIIESKSFEPYYVVDGQQRLTTSIILIQTILEKISDEELINYTSAAEIRKKFIFDSKDGGISRSYIFGYDKDNPSYEFLKTKIFKEFSSTSKSEETVYTNNLENAKLYFADKIEKFSTQELETLYKKVTQSLLFNIFTISEEVDVCVAFETMNNRGKPLSYLELLKNRLIYLSLKINEVEYEKSKLRTSINECWKAIYHSLGRNKTRPLEDDLFLSTHYPLYFAKPALLDADELEEPVSRPVYDRRYMRQQDHYTKLLEETFVQRRVVKSDENGSSLGLSEIYDYVSSLQVSVNYWYKIFNPSSINPGDASSIWLDKLDRIGNKSFLPLILSVMTRVEKDSERVSIFKALERYIFAMGLIEHPYYYNFEYHSGFLKEASQLYSGKINSKHLEKKIQEAATATAESPRFHAEIRSNFRSNGYYRWNLIRYFLYEYNLDMQLRSKTDRRKLHWAELVDKLPDHKTIEHIYPQVARTAYWTERFVGLTPKQRDYLRNSLGNLVPLSQAKNASLSNRSFPEKVEGKRDAVIGFRFGCYAENEVSMEPEWTPTAIKARGMKLLNFMEKRWSLNLGSDSEKVEMLNLDFLS
ncbi:hypothetical protein CO653_04930 [Rhizobium anhuiense]|uniref:DUF262 domain-containing protein n=1 Tax=Rhizobium anhuiense TaxID=1184720 RepID=UPI000BE97CB2|nr:DUF262 domain-containing protein [Rhizobium anhuiense]PDS67621.1 hypothetical protein CO653_04930 [Rhizobium anhuiense]